MFETGTVAEVGVVCDGTGEDGYLVAKVGDRVEILHHEPGWVFARTVLKPARDGWMSVLKLVSPEGCSKVSLGDIVTATKALRPAVNSGYLHADAGDRLQIIHIGSHKTDDADWLFARRVGDMGAAIAEGWLSADAIGSLHVLHAIKEAFQLQQVPLEETPENEGLTMVNASNELPQQVSLAVPPEKPAIQSTEVPITTEDSAAPSMENLQEAPLLLLPMPSRACPEVPDNNRTLARRLSSRSSKSLAPCRCIKAEVSPTPDAPAVPSSSSTAPYPACPAPAPAPTGRSRSVPTLAAAGGSRSVPKASHYPAASIASPSPRAGLLKLLTFGLEKLDGELAQLCADSAGPEGGGGATVWVDDETLRRALRRQGEPRVDLVIDARAFPDPNAKHTTRHIGVNPEIITRIVHHRHFTWFLQDVEQQWRRAVALQRAQRSDQELSMVVAVYCRSGKHRSVAIAECLRYIGMHVEGLTLVDNDVKHMSKKKWGSGICRGGCEECSGYQPVRERALEFAADIWRHSQYR